MSETEYTSSIDAEYLAGRRFPYQEDMSLVEDVDLLAATPGEDINWLEDVELLEEDGVPAVFDRYSNSFLKIYFPIPSGRGDEIARKVLIKHLQSGNSYGVALKERHCKFPQPELGPWVQGSRTVGADWKPSVLEGWEASPALTPPRQRGGSPAVDPTGPADHDRVRVRRAPRPPLRGVVDVREMREEVGHAADPDRGVRASCAARSRGFGGSRWPPLWS